MSTSSGLRDWNGVGANTTSVRFILGKFSHHTRQINYKLNICAY
jgi:hypothetical protein